jgi:surfactin synthase thioesterase subunit
MPHGPVTLLCLPYAGAGASVFWSWTALDVAGLSIVPVQLPGREERLADEPHQDVHQAVDALLPEVCELTTGTGRVALFGHSLGAVLAYELSRRLVAGTGVGVAHLFVSGSAVPSTVRGRRATGLPDEEFLARVAELSGYRDPLLDHPEMRELLLPTLRADVAMHEDYRPASAEPLEVPVTAVRGSDDQLIPAAQVERWRAVTTGPFRAVQVPGGHMYLREQPRLLLDLIAGVVGQRLARPG